MHQKLQIGLCDTFMFYRAKIANIIRIYFDNAYEGESWGFLYFNSVIYT